MNLFQIFPLIFATASAIVLNGTQLSELEIDGRIGRAEYAIDGMFPFQACLMKGFANKGFCFCGGALIDTKWVLTAAHCLEGISVVTVQLGSVKPTNPVLKVPVRRKNFYIHGSYNKITLLNDIALIKIPESEVTSKVWPISLPRSAITAKTFYGIACGWGQLPNEKNVLKNCLRWDGFELLPAEVCEAMNRLPPSSICVKTYGGAGGASLSPGDAGGSLISMADGTLIGILSRVSNGYRTTNSPAVYVRVADYLGWISEKIKAN